MTREEILALEEMNFNAWPALKTVHYDGWVIRCSGGASRRPNSVNCVVPSKLPLADKIDTAAALYARWQQRTVFRLTPLADEGLDAILGQRGYSVEEPTYVQIADVTPAPVADSVRIFLAADAAWIDAAVNVRKLSRADAPIFAAQHRTVAIHSAWALVEINGQPSAVGVAAMERGWVGLHGIHVAKDVRRAGLARRLSAALLGFAYAQGARRAWLQVAHANAAALPLYHSLGFRTAYSYHHRVNPN